MSNLKYWLWLSALRGLGTGKKLELLDQLGTPEGICYADDEELARSGADRRAIESIRGTSLEEADRILGECQRLGLRVLTIQDTEYPDRLRNIYDPPLVLYVRGHMPLFDEELAVAMVGTRDCTPYGIMAAEDLSYAMTRQGALIVSGLAAGIDAAAHRGALRSGGVTAAVLGNGHDVVYPKENRYLYEDIAVSGVILSEYPPGTPPLSWHFPTRNRIISGLSDAVLVIEAGEKSGSLITVDMALEQGRDIYALPGPVNSSMSRGCNYLIQQGAGLMTSPEMLLKEWGIDSCSVSDGKAKNKKVLETPEKLVYSCLGLYPKNIEQIAEETKLSPRELVGLLVSLELQGYAREISKNNYVAAEKGCRC